MSVTFLVICKYETWYLNSKEEHGLKDSEYLVLNTARYSERRKEGYHRKLRNERCYSPHIAQIIKLRKVV